MIKIKCLLICTFLIVGFISLNCNQPQKCKKVKNGKFYYYAKMDGRKILIERIDSLQIETDAKRTEVLKSKIVWENDCKYKIFVNAFSDNKLTQEDSLLATKAGIIEIIDIKPDFYICTAKFSTSKKNYEFRDTMYYQK
ncbi:MAG: hypothetical protein JNM14_07470 [Ferruginibacter sp.]|nr:hypothetical protein [Ferruginibacter sp.]